MSEIPDIESFSRITPMIYAYSTPGVSYHNGWVKIGYTEKQSVKDRIAQQTHTADVKTKLEWQDNAIYKDGSGKYFTDREFHHYLEVDKKVERTPDTEWFHVDGRTSHEYFYDFASRELPEAEEDYEYTLRQEQQRAVDMTMDYFNAGGTEFLWNAKPRFGKTLTSYDLVREMGFKKVLIVSNRPSISNSWLEDFNKFIGWRRELCFISDTDALKDKPGVMSRDEYLDMTLNMNADDVPGFVAFESLQGLKGSVYFGGKFDKLQWMVNEYTDDFGQKQKGMDFDLLIVDESQEGVDTIKTDRAFRYISRKHTLYLSGTPFKAIANEQFKDDQIFNWSYADEQEAKKNWSGDEFNPYESLPRLNMYTYQLSNMIFEQIQKGLDLSDEDTVEYAFDLNEFFATNESGKFIHEEEVKKFLHALTTQEKYPFSTPELRKELSHTMWLLNRVSSAKALAKLLKNDPVFSEYEVVVAAGDGKSEDDDEAMVKAFDRVKEAIATHDKTITLTVGQLTVGVTIPKWSGVLMLCNLQSPSSYMQAAFRAQNPCTYTESEARVRKENAYVFDFDPARTLIIFDEFANNLSPDTVNGKGTGEDRKKNIKTLLNFFPVIGEDTEGKMVELDATQVISIPRRIKSQEVVRRGFMSNFLFQNINNVFGAPGIVREIVEKLTPAKEEPKKREKDALSGMEDISVDENGDAEVPNEIIIGKTQDLFGPKVYENMEEAVSTGLDNLVDAGKDVTSDNSHLKDSMDQLKDTIKEAVKKEVVEPVTDDYDVKSGTKHKMERQVDKEIDDAFDKLQSDYEQQANIAQVELDRKRMTAETDADIKKAEDSYQSKMKTALKDLTEGVQKAVQKTIDEKPKDLVEQMERRKANEEKKTMEDEVRDHLRGFSRTIPSFIMAYGDENLTLANFDDYTEDDVFEEVTGIPESDFRFLRDGGDWYNSETGETEHFDGHLFDEVVFDDSIQEFLHKKQELADYFDESQDEDIFDYIPPQKTNQIFTPKWVVEKMVDELEENNPGCFDDPTNTFADLYMKSGLYITEIVKRLFRSEKMKEFYPDDTERIQHILREQVYGMAPTRIIYLISTNYILGFDEKLKSETKNFVQADAAKAAKENRLQELVNKSFNGTGK